jgi:SulP family sulfate permease
MYATGRQLDLDRDLRAIGAANIAGASMGGMVGYPAVSTTYLGWRVGLEGAGAPLAAAGACAAVGFFGTELLTFLPKGLFAAIVGFLGLDLLFSSAKAARCRLSRADYLLFLGVVMMAATVGFLEAMAIGFFMAIILFARAAGRIDVLHARHTLATRAPRTERIDADMLRLARDGRDIVIIELTGYLFFGACSRLRRLCDEELSAVTGPPDSIVLDFSRVSGLDVSAALALVEFENRCAATGAGLLIAGGCPSAIATLGTVKGAGGGTIRSHDTLENALFRIEEIHRRPRFQSSSRA